MAPRIWLTMIRTYVVAEGPEGMGWGRVSEQAALHVFIHSPRQDAVGPDFWLKGFDATCCVCLVLEFLGNNCFESEVAYA